MTSRSTIFVAATMSGALLLNVGSSIAIAQQADVLDPAQHPSSPQASTGFTHSLLPLDTRLSWTERFLGDERFNPNVKLNQLTDVESAEGMKMDSADGGHAHAASHGMDGSGTVKSISRKQGKIKIEHGPIERLGMPAMTMVFKVGEPTALDAVSNGQSINFNVENTSGGFVITEIVSANESQVNDGGFDARGEVRAVRSTQSKIKVKHGRIEHLGMPPMTMMFTVSNPDMLANIEKGAVIDFSVENTAGGFVITNLREVKEGEQ